MIPGDVLERTHTMIKLEPRHWAWARLLGEARTASNDNRRAARSDRGKFNLQVNLLGALGELFLLRATQAADLSEEAVAYMRDHLYRKQGVKGVEGPDIRFLDHTTSETHELDVKTFDCMPNKQFFAINDNKHDILRGQCSSYLYVIAPRFGRRMAVSWQVPYAEIEEWSVERLRHGGSASRNLQIERFLKDYFTKPPVLESLREAAFWAAEVCQAYEDSIVRAEFWGHLCRMSLNLERHQPNARGARVRWSPRALLNLFGCPEDGGTGRGTCLRMSTAHVLAKAVRSSSSWTT